MSTLNKRTEALRTGTEFAPEAGQDDEFGAAKIAYHEQIEFGSALKSALNLASIVYQQRNPFVPVCEARARIADALGIQIA